MAGHNIEWPAGDPDLGSHEMRLFVPAAFARGERSCSPPHTTTLRAPVWRRLRTAVLPLAAALLAWVPPASANAQGTGGTVVGRVTDAATGQPIQQARVLVQGTQNGALTTENGRYSLRIPSAGPIVLEVSRIGYEAKKLNVTAGGTAPVVADAALTQAAFSLSAVVTTVTGQQRKVELANATATVNVAEKIAELPVANMGQLLSGRAAGVQVVSAGATGAGSRIRIRGQASLSLSNDPVVIIDGVRMTATAGSSSIGVGGSAPSRLDDLNPEEIENIEVVKGPSAATLYGTEAANGVINITTKKGKSGRTRWNLYSENGAITNPNEFPLMYFGWGTQLSGATAGNRVRCPAISVAAGLCRADSLRVGNAFLIDSLTPIDRGSRQQYGMQVSGGNDRVQYFVSGETEGETGIYKMPEIEVRRLTAERNASLPGTQLRPNALDRNSLRANLTAQISQKATLQISSGFIASRQRLPQNEDNGNGLMVGMLGGEWREDLVDGRGVKLLGWRAFPMGDILSNVTTQNVNRFINSAQLQYQPYSWLNTRAVFGIDFASRADQSLQRNEQGVLGVNRAGFVNNNRSEINQQTVDLGGTATRQLTSSLGSKTSFGLQYIRNFFNRVGGTGQGLPPGAVTITAGAIRNASQETDEKRTLGYYVEQQFNWNEKLFITAAMRRDAASAFGKDFRAVNYPKLGASWLISDQSFFPQADWISSLRLRATYGASGQIPGATDALRFLSPFGTTISGSADQPGVTIGALGNATLKPEYSAETEAGFDLNMFGGKSNIEVTYYDKNTTDALIERRVAPSIAGVTSRFENIGNVRNSGLELVYNQRVIDGQKLGLEFVLTGSTNKNELVTLGEGVSPIPTGNRNTQLNAPGYPLYGLWGRTYTYKDANGDGILVAGEMTYGANQFIGPSFPTREVAFSPTVELLNKKLRISGQLDSKWGMKKLNNTKRHQCQAGVSCQGLYTGAPLEEQAMAVAAAASVFTGFYEDGSFTRFRELSVAYTMPDKWAKAVRAERWNVVFTGRNLGVWTPFTGVDPETTVGNGDQRGNEEFFSTPPMRYWTLRMNFNF
ncbi:SusC/RagA family TonB-linked outer membrane protein [Gemmatimonas sp.]|jgi:TonB-linked SusC/RagA family outer membrane protein|uniref:SusC/RagA family TonB-linked outer membrane protein n=1 Tax=Gemmatimonas sp. TaxID=1962908 RepID=UPI0037C1B0FD